MVGRGWPTCIRCLEDRCGYNRRVDIDGPMWYRAVELRAWSIVFERMYDKTTTGGAWIIGVKDTITVDQRVDSRILSHIPASSLYRYIVSFTRMMSKISIRL